MQMLGHRISIAALQDIYRHSDHATIGLAGVRFSTSVGTGGRRYHSTYPMYLIEQIQMNHPVKLWCTILANAMDSSV
jgi:hypothetical protein